MTTTRFCPLCELRLQDKTCPVDGVPTVEIRAEVRTEATLPSGTVIAKRYRIVRPLGAGGMGEVFLAKQLSVQRDVAIKVLTGACEGPEPEKKIRRFYKEAQAASALHHPNVVRVYDFGVDDTTRFPYLVMELVEGEMLSQLIAKEGPLTEQHAAYLLAQVARGLVEAHQKGIVHRDLKPQNIMLSVLADGYEHVRLLDFGIARMRGAGGNDVCSPLTAEGVAMGTPEYMSPEQSRGADLDFRSDLYSLGCVLHTVLTGKAPFRGKESMAVMLKHLHDPPPPLDRPLADGKMPSEDLRRLHDALLEKSPEDRPASTAVVAQILQALADGEQPGVKRLMEIYRERERPASVVVELPTPSEVMRVCSQIAAARGGSTLSDSPRAMGEAVMLPGENTMPLDRLTGSASGELNIRMGRGTVVAWGAAIAAAMALAIALMSGLWLLGYRQEMLASANEAPAPRVVGARSLPVETPACAIESAAERQAVQPAEVAVEKAPKRLDAARKKTRARKAAQSAAHEKL